ncbi:hypothetical protein D1B33_00160 [Lysinibacillus yapensis]|uniref:RNA polymerase alpha subunit C-terminal domain-containing protein n=1 Tax=Ureibacillus yapensis TaxID=2304605 RepID=A0A396SES5_9BACL|nr:RNA polymerase alpha subunit C-terminal domain-containing protein [Lysinibacillus yapensis]RHW40150.1 hypothetical protein D1B33_00160 [Lysinibacillus yapensis]
MASSEKVPRICKNGHQYYKSSDCNTCPTCEKANRPDNGFLSLLSAPARRALLHRDITTLEQLSAYSEKEILSLHGIGPSSIPKLKAALSASGLAFRQ